MPNRILRDWTDSEAIDKLSWQAEVMFIRLIMKADDYGRYNANWKILKSTLFPLRLTIRETDISRWTTELVQAGLIRTAEAEAHGKSIIEILKFNQRTRSKQSKYVLPGEEEGKNGFPDPSDPSDKSARPPDDGHMTVTCQTHDGLDGDVFVDGDVFGGVCTARERANPPPANLLVSTAEVANA